MEREVADYILTVLANAPLQVNGSELVKLADLHSRAVQAIEEAAVSGD